ncbi:hypothetical protein JW911_02750 [Candidatus Peregrinibacteria bacterium]|nr:hypothetical protein [Candidatus Peregrinibacteria bacterium]
MRFRADFHIHTDYSANNGWHGEKPQVIAEALNKSNLDIAAVLEHNKVTERYNDVKEALMETQEVNLTRTKIKKEILVLLGCEISCIYDRFLYHIGYIFKDPYARTQLPDTLKTNCSLEDIEQYKDSYPGVAIVFHPAWRDHTRNSHSATTDLIGSGVIDGVELLNGSIFDNIQRHSNGRRAGEVKKWFRNFEFALSVFKNVREALVKQGVKLAAIGCSDAHRAKMIGTMYTEYTAHKKEDVFEEIAKGATISVCAANGEVRKKVKSLLGRNGAGHVLKVLRKP